MFSPPPKKVKRGIRAPVTKAALGDEDHADLPVTAAVAAGPITNSHPKQAPHPEPKVGEKDKGQYRPTVKGVPVGKKEGRYIKTRVASRGKNVSRVPKEMLKSGGRTGGIRKDEDRQFDKVQFLEALKETYGHYGLACREVGFSDQSVRYHRRKDPEFNEACVFIMQSCRDGILDDAAKGAKAVRLEAQTLLHRVLNHAIMQELPETMSVKEILEVLRTSMEYIAPQKGAQVNVVNQVANVTPATRPGIRVSVEDVEDNLLVDKGDREARLLRLPNQEPQVIEVESAAVEAEAA